MWTRSALVLLVTFSLPAAVHAAAAPTAPPASGDAERVTKLADAYVAEFLRRFPENAVFAGMEPPAFHHFSDASPSALAAWQELEDGWWSALAGVDGNALCGRPEWITYGFLREALAASRGLRACRSELWHVSQMDGWQVFMPELAGALPVDTPERRASMLRLWSSLPAYVTTEITNLESGLAAGYSAPRHNVELVIAQLDGLLAAPVGTSPWHGPAAHAGDPAFAKAWDALVAETIVPAMRRYRAFLAERYLPRARTSIGVSALPDGEACYAASLRSYTGLAVSPREMFASGERAVAARQAHARELARKVYGSPDLTTLRARLEKDPANHFQTREQVLAFSQAAVDRATQALPNWFGIVPAAPVRIEPIAAFDEEHGVPHYVPGTADGARPGTYAISLYQPEKQDRSGLESTAFHETVPGHHLQVAIAQRRPQAHPITRLLWNSGFGEGWAVYAEETADEMGLFSSDLTRLGEYIQLPTGMVADPGIHVMGWTRQQTIDYFLATRPDYSAERAASQADRIAVLPGQLTTYFAGALEIRALRELAQKALGERFDVRQFHDRVLEDGAVTLPMLREKIERWVKTVPPPG
jgi:uncharacterized protein (DUF885 family)